MGAWTASVSVESLDRRCPRWQAGGNVRYMANSRPAEGVDAEQLTRFFKENGVSSAAWDLIRRRVVTEYAFKVGDVPGVVLFLDVESPEDASAVVNELAAVHRGLIAFDVEPIGKAMRL